MSFSRSGRTFLAFLATVKSASPLFFEGVPAENTFSWSGSPLDFPGVPEEREIAAAGGAVNFRISCNRVPKCLVQEFSAAIALIGNVETLGPDVGELGGAEPHEPPPLDSSSSQESTSGEF